MVALAAACHRLARAGYGTSTSGNASVRLAGADGAERFALTPTGVAMAEVAPENIAVVDAAGSPLNGRRPTKEWEGHLAIYRHQPATRAILHAHPSHAIAVSTLLEPGAFLPAVTPQFVMRCGLVPVIAYHPPGSAGLAAAIARHVGGHRALVLRNHGVHAMGPDLAQAFGALKELEENCRQWLLAGGRGATLGDTEVRALLGRKM